MSQEEAARTPPRVFISYAQYEPEHAGRVLALAQALAADGVDVELDQFHAHELVDWPRWCEERLRPENTDFVLLVCTAEYRRRIEGRVDLDQGRGVFWEGDLIYGDLYRAKANERFVPLLLDDEPESSLPPIVANWNHFRFRRFGLASRDSGYEALYRLLTGQPAISKPKPGQVVRLGPRPVPTATSPQMAADQLASTGVAMDRNTFRQFKSLLLSLPVWSSIDSRMAFLQDVFFGHRLLNQFSAGGAADVAATQLLQLLAALEAPDVEGLTPTCALLKAIRENFGAGPQRGAVLSELEGRLCQPAVGFGLEPAVAAAGQLRSILYLAANPQDERLDLVRSDREFKQIREALRAPGKRVDIGLHPPELALRRHDLTRTLHDTQPNIVHFSGHGEGDEGILFEDEQGRAKPVSAEALASVFRMFSHCVKVVVLNACFSEPQAEAIAEHIDHVIGTRDAIGDDAATAFSIGFYRALAAGRSIADGFQLGCAEIRMADIPEHAVPILMTGPGKVTRCAD